MIFQKGFTLTEILVVMALFTLILAFGVNMDLSIFRRSAFQNERSKIVSILERARSHAMANMFESSYGVCYVEPNYIIFRERLDCLPAENTDENIPADTNIASHSLTSFPTIIFNRLSGNANNANIHITDGDKSSDITINNEGRINW